MRTLDQFLVRSVRSANFYSHSSTSSQCTSIGGTMPGLTIGDTVPNLELDSTHGKIRIHDYVGDGYAIIFSHAPRYYTLARPYACMRTHILSISVLNY
jgi:hypothetical protein